MGIVVALIVGLVALERGRRLRRRERILEAPVVLELGRRRRGGAPW